MKITEISTRDNLPAHVKERFRYIVPASGAFLERYEPVIQTDARYHASEDKPVIGLQGLQDLNLGDEQSILDWCSKFGLLGILPQTVTLIRLASRWWNPPGGGGDKLLFPSQLIYSRSNVGWSSTRTLSLSGQGTSGIEIDSEYRFEDWFNSPVAADDTSPSTRFCYQNYVVL